MKHIELFAADGQWYFRIVARNGRTIAQSEGYSRKRNARASAELIAAGGADIVEAA